MPERGALKLSDAEWTVMRAVWIQAPATARDVLDRVGRDTDWAYTTVKTLLARLVEKDALGVRMKGNVSRYEPRISRRRARVRWDLRNAVAPHHHRREAVREGSRGAGPHAPRSRSQVRSAVMSVSSIAAGWWIWMAARRIRR
jgi:hypothetical protein